MFYVNLLQSLWKSNLLRLWSHLHMCIKISILITYTIGLKSFWGHILLKFQCQKCFLHFRFFIDKNFKNQKPKKSRFLAPLWPIIYPECHFTWILHFQEKAQKCGMYSSTLFCSKVNLQVILFQIDCAFSTQICVNYFVTS